MKRLLSLFAAIILLASCAAIPIEPEPEYSDGWEFPEPEGLFVVHQVDNLGMARHGLINALGDVVVPFEYDHISILWPSDSLGMLQRALASERFFKAVNFENVMHDLELGWALISPEGNFLTGFNYAYIGWMPGDPPQIIARRMDTPGYFVFLNSYGVESPIEDMHIIHTLAKRYFWDMPREEWLHFGPDVPEQGFELIIETQSGNFWGISTPAESVEDEPDMPEIRLYDSDGFLVDNHVYHLVEYIGEGLYIAVTHIYRRSESFIVNYNGRRLAGPYELFIHHPDALPFLLGIAGRNANVLSTDNFREQHTIQIPTGGRINLFGKGLQSFVATSSHVQPLTLTMLGSGEAIIFEAFINYTLGGHNSELDRFILHGVGGPELPSHEADTTSFLTMLVDRQGGILLLAENISPQLGFLVVEAYNEDDELKFGLVDWDGNILLPFEFDHLEVLPGNALFAVQPERIGIIDLGGNWIYY